MGTKVSRRLAQLVGAACFLVLSASCNMPGFGKNQNLGSQSQALTGSGNQPAGSGGQSGGSAGSWSTRLEYDHNFSFVYPGSSSVQMEVAVKGAIPLTPTQIGLGPTIKCVEGETPYFQESGSASIPFEASAEWGAGDDHCTCSLPDSIEVNILGKSYFEWLTPGDKCPQPRIALQVKEKWFTEHQWQCTCDDPEQTEHLRVEVAMAMFPMVGNPDLEKKTMVFPFGCPAVSTLEETLSDPSGMGSGTYRWTFSSGINEGPGRYKLGPSFEGWEPGMSTEPIQCISGEWGPPLETIVQPVREWLE